MSKKTVGVFCGGVSAEHQVSLASASTIYKALQASDAYDVLIIGIDTSNEWYLGTGESFFQNRDDMEQIALGRDISSVVMTLGGEIRDKQTYEQLAKIDIAFPIIHGTGGEDGALQGFFETLQVPYVGPGILGAAIGMDKDVSKRLLAQAGIPVTPSYCATSANIPAFQKVEQELGLPLFVKPVSLGSSVGISKVTNEEEFESALHKALGYDHKILIEKMVFGREVECAVLGNHIPQASKVLGQIVAKDNFYSYEAKYLDAEAAKLQIPAELDLALQEALREVAVHTFQVLECRGLARVDFFVQDDGSFFVNEVNTLPGFTSISMYPELWKASGVSLERLCEQLVCLAWERYEYECTKKA